MGRIPEETIQSVIEANDIVDVITGYVPDLKRAGSTFKACCPFHMEKTPSFVVNPSRQSFKCFGCGEGGNVLSFVMKTENLPFIDAVKKLAHRANIPIIEEAETAQQAKERKARSRLKELHNDLARFLHEQLMTDPAAEHARAYLQQRGFSNEMAERWLIGWHPENQANLITWAKEKGYKARELVQGGIANANDDPRRGLYYRFKDRLMFPVHNDYGDVVAFSGRQLREDPRSGKYINSPETLIFKKSRIFFGLDKARVNIPKLGYALLCEGQIDVIACHERGFNGAVASQGTAFTPEQAAILKRYCKTVLICYDADAAGQKATQGAFTELAKVGLQVKVVSLPPGEDPDSLMQGQGEEAFRTLLDEALEFFDYKIRYESTQRKLENPSEKAALAQELSELLAAMSDNFQLQASLSFLATRLGMREEDLRNASRITHKREARLSQRRKMGEDARAEEVPRAAVMNESLAALCHISMNFPEAYDWMQEQIEPLYSLAESFQGAEVFHTLLSEQPRPESPEVISTFLDKLPDKEKLTLTPLKTYLNPAHPIAQVTDPLNEATDIFKSLSLVSLENTRKTLTVRLAQPNLPAPEQRDLQDQIRQISETIKEVKRSA